MNTIRRRPLSPGEHLLDLMKSFQLTVGDLAQYMLLDVYDVMKILDGRNKVDAYWADCLGELFATSDDFWLNLQARYDVAASEGLLEEEP